MTARRRRFTRLRTTAPPTALETAKPAMLFASPVSAMCTTTVRRPDRDPRRITDWKSADDVSRDDAGSTLRRDLGTTLATTCREDRATRTGAHAQAEAVRLSALAVVRLESPLAHSMAPERLNGGGQTARQLYAARGPPVKSTASRWSFAVNRLGSPNTVLQMWRTRRATVTKRCHRLNRLCTSLWKTRNTEGMA